MNEHPLSELAKGAIGKIKEMIDVSAVIGDPITCGNGVTIMPVSRVSVGFASGGTDLPSKKEKPLFGGGTGGGVTVTPTAFLVVKGDDVRLLPLYSTATTTDRIVENAPGIIDKIGDLFQSKTEKTDNNE